MLFSCRKWVQRGDWKRKHEIIPFERKKNSEDGKGHFVPHPKGAKTIREVNYEGNY